MTKKIKLDELPQKLRLFVWENVLNEWTSGAMWALAYDVDQARELCVRAAYPDWRVPPPHAFDELKKDPLVIDEPHGFAVRGGG